MRDALLFLVSSLVALSPATAAQGLRGSAPQAATPKLEPLVQRYLQWRGGTAFAAMKTLRINSTVETGGLSGSVREWLDESGRTREDSDFAVTKQVAVRTPLHGWNKDDGLVSPVGHFDVADTQHDLQVQFGDALRPGSNAAVTRLSDEDVDGGRYAIVRVAFAANDFVDLLLDPATGALHGTRTHRDGRTTFTRLGDWRVVDGVRLPFLRESYRANGKLDSTVKVTAARVNERFAESLFDRPEAETSLHWAGAGSTGPLPFNLLNGNRIYIPSTVNGAPVEVLLDSGAETTILDKSFAQRIGSKSVGSVTAVGTGGEDQAGLANDVTITIGNMTLDAGTVGVLDLSGVSKRIGVPLPVILGRQVFLQSIVDLDLSGPTIAFIDPAAFTPPANAVEVPLEPLNGLRTVPVSVEGRPAVPMTFDLGNGGYMFLEHVYWQHNRLLDGRPSSTRSSGAIGGENINRVATLKSVRFAGTTFRDVPAQFNTADVETDSDRQAGNVGLPLLGRFRLLIDFPHNRLFAIPLTDRVARPFERDRAGLRVVRDGNRLDVTYVAERSPASAAGWAKGDAIVAIDGKPVGPQTPLGPAGGLISAPAGTTVVLTMADGSKRRLTLANYF